jgi:hypothetical protein
MLASCPKEKERDRERIQWMNMMNIGSVGRWMTGRDILILLISPSIEETEDPVDENRRRMDDVYDQRSLV